jgi:Fe2+ or Zn2+ uptake regulation protein
LGIDQKWIFETLKKAENNKLDYENLLEKFKQENPESRKFQLDRPLKTLEERGIIHKKMGFLCLS